MAFTLADLLRVLELASGFHSAATTDCLLGCGFLFCSGTRTRSGCPMSSLARRGVKLSAAALGVRASVGTQPTGASDIERARVVRGVRGSVPSTSTLLDVCRPSAGVASSPQRHPGGGMRGVQGPPRRRGCRGWRGDLAAAGRCGVVQGVATRDGDCGSIADRDVRGVLGAKGNVKLSFNA